MEESYRHVFGPLSSSRLGVSLGVNTIPLKTCNLSCVYCQLGRTNRMTNTRRDAVDPDEILTEMRHAIGRYRDTMDTVTFAGEGEPTLCLSLGRLIRQAKQMTDLPVAVITNGTLFWQPDVRDDVLEADVVIPSLDAADVHTFQKLNRPHRRLHHDRIIDGLAAFRQMFSGDMRIEVMLIAGVNDTDAALMALREGIRHIQPDSVYLNLPFRPAAESDVRGPRTDRIQRAWEMLEDICPVEQGFGTGRKFRVAMDADAVRRLARSHPISVEQAKAALGGAVNNRIETLMDDGEIVEVKKGNASYLRGGEVPDQP